ncbi:MAG: hypothetical protein IK144_09250 [Bacteroidaceae bacterium]|nr:hypothetical protein [Bacteroidaceae bacterium]
MKRALLIIIILLACPLLRAQNPDSLTFAVLGNSISTYYDYLPAGYAVYYTQDREKNYGFQVGDTWWMQLSRLSGLTFLANASWSGSRVACDVLNSNAPFLSNHRVNALGRAGKPDFIFIAGGTNDWNTAKVPLGSYRTSNFTDSVTFRGAYQRLLYKLTKWYPKARIVCLSIFPRGNGVNDVNAMGWSQADANASIKYIAQQFGQYYIDCTSVPWSSNWGASTFDYLHPTAYGGTQLASHICNALVSQKIITRALKRSNEVEEAERLLDLSFTADGIVNQGTYDAPKIGRHGTATTVYDARNDTYYGCTKSRSSDYFYVTYDDGTPLVDAFNNSVTWEMLVRLDALADQGGGIGRACFLGNEENGGWAFYNSELASSFCYWNKSGVKSTVKSITGDSILVAGKFYHLVLTMDRTSHIMRYFINGKLVCTGTRAGTDMVMPQCGSVKGRKGMWICLGGDATSSTYNSGAENSTACSFVFARIYNGAFSQKAALKLYNDDVKRFTEPQTAYGTELIMDCEFTPDGAVNHAPSFVDKPIVMMDEVPVNYNPAINLFESQFSGSKSQYFKYAIGDDPGIMNQLSDAYSVEVFCRNSDALPSFSTRPLGFVNGYGFGLQMNNKGNIGYTTTTQGNKADGSSSKTQWTWVGAGSLTTDYTHYVIVYDRKNYRSQFYINGELVDTRWLTFKECPVYEWTPSTWLAIGGDASGTYEQTSSVGGYPFIGDIAMVRIYGRSLSQNEIQGLAGILETQERTYTFGSNGYAAVCLPYIYQVPEGCTAYIVSEIVSSSVMLKPIAQAGEYVPYGTPVLIHGPARATITLKAEDKQTLSNSPLKGKNKKSPFKGDLEGLVNLLAGTYPGKTLAAGEGYYMRATGTNIYRATADVILPPFSCYLPSAEKRSYYKLEEASTGINEIKNEELRMKNEAGVVYNLAGQRLQKLQKGINIVDGNKIVIK